MSIFFEVVPENKNYRSPKATNRAYSWRQSPKAQQIPKACRTSQKSEISIFPETVSKKNTNSSKNKQESIGQNMSMPLEKFKKQQKTKIPSYSVWLYACFWACLKQICSHEIIPRDSPKKTEPQKPIGKNIIIFLETVHQKTATMIPRCFIWLCACFGTGLSRRMTFGMTPGLETCFWDCLEECAYVLIYGFWYFCFFRDCLEKYNIICSHE